MASAATTQPTDAAVRARTPAPLGALAAGRAPRGLWTNAWRQFRRNKLAMAGLVYLVFLAFVAIFAPSIAPHNPVQSDLATAGRLRQAAWITTDNPKTTGTWDYPLGTDGNGRDVFSRLVFGTRISLVVGFIPMAVILLIGVPIGLAAGFAGGRADNILMRFTDIVYAFPALLFFIIMQISLGETPLGRLLNGLVLLFLTLSIINWTGVARLVRGETLSLKEKEFIEAVRASGAGAGRVILRHILPNALGPIIVAAAFIVPGAIIAEAVLSYLGIGLRPDVDLNAPFPTSWGQMIQLGQTMYRIQPWLLIAPSVAVALITLAFTFVGDGLRDALDPREQL
ncbi:MAG TPA: ABC transporter permease [Thermomicrobiales bacterium]|nr:ABC transporter permease [Thermomicrobiales bacterium]